MTTDTPTIQAGPLVPKRPPLDWIARHWPALALAASATMLGAAHAFESFGGLAPCHLCLKQREVYWVAGTVGLIATILQRTGLWTRLRRPTLWLLAVIFLYGAGLAAFHAGVEWKWWPGPSTCTGGGLATSDDLVAMLKGAKIAAPMCDKAAWVFLGLSMAGWNALVSLGLAVVSAFSALRSKEAVQ
ncbi:disulfide bond formation protein B [Caulobacter hibisci]|uniref:Disulfide bond formation protein B n=1 Tax=Caulobacter hibisci TaxID=2035993 RepID=A0ABS0ST48_9CAUL|nr:disulfide bond formation protein B [Caulobacter hibisci]MBI1682521.1 disulfide bond formation protein B [Caulobacter hibisci]